MDNIRDLTLSTNITSNQISSVQLQSVNQLYMINPGYQQYQNIDPYLLVLKIIQLKDEQALLKIQLNLQKHQRKRTEGILRNIEGQQIKQKQTHNAEIRRIQEAEKEEKKKLEKKIRQIEAKNSRLEEKVSVLEKKIQVLQGQKQKQRTEKYEMKIKMIRLEFDLQKCQNQANIGERNIWYR